LQGFCLFFEIELASWEDFRGDDPEAFDELRRYAEDMSADGPASIC
jgi:hypothetical protein